LNIFSEPFTPVFLDRLQELLPRYLSASRWYRAKTRTIQHVSVHDVVTLHEEFFLVVVDVEYLEKDSDRYILPMEVPCLTTSAPEALAIDALANPHLRDALLKAVAAGAVFRGTKGRFIAARAGAFQLPATQHGNALESFVSRAEQSNTSIIYPSYFIFKLFRKIEPGINPDLEVGGFLSEHGFRNTPAFLGSLEYQDAAGSYTAGILQQFVPNHGDAWKYTMDELAAFFKRAETSPDSPHLLDGYLASARLLGIRTAEMHTALASTNTGDFAPEPFTATDARQLSEEITAQAGRVFGLLRLKLSSLDDATAGLAFQVLALESQISDRLAKLNELLTSGPVRIRIHGDYHLGQVLFTGDDFMIIDFEGEPARPLAERRSKALAMRDVAGMLRSFDYAAYAAPETHGKNQTWAAFWLIQVTAAYLEAYFETAAGHPYISADPAGNKFLLDVFLLQKALYEVAYELNNRPDWVYIPLRGILSLFSRSSN
jgi:maltose alpha-D-glucosyltransferase/alpha-amylase